MPNTPVVHKDLHVVHTVVAKYDASVDASGKSLMVLPKDALVLEAKAYVATAFNGTSPTMTFGKASDTDMLMSSTVVAPATAGIKSNTAAEFLTGGLNTLLADDTEIIATEGGTSVTAGVVYLVVSYAYPLELV